MCYATPLYLHVGRTRGVKPGTHHAIFVFCWTQRRRKDDCCMVCAHQRQLSPVDFTNATVVGPIRKTNRSNNCCMVCARQRHLLHQPTGTRYATGSLSASTAVGGRRVCSQLPSRSVCGHSTIVAWCVRVIQQSSSSSPQTTIVGPTKVAWCVPSFMHQLILYQHNIELYFQTQM